MAAASARNDMELVDLGDSGKGGNKIDEQGPIPPGNPPPYTAGPGAPYPMQQQQPVGAYAQPMVYPPPYGHNHSNYPGYEQTIHVQPRTVTMAPVIAISCLGPAPVRMQCPYCFQMITTMSVTSPSFAAYMSCMMMFLFLLWLCCWIPFVMDGCKTTKHFCPNCKRIIGIYNP